MQVGFRLQQLLEEYKDGGHGAIQRICNHTGLKRHEVSAMLRNHVEYLRLDALAGVCRYMIEQHRMDPADLPGRLLALEPGDFWSLISGKCTLRICFGVRAEMPDSNVSWVMAPDSVLHGVLLHELFGLGREERPVQTGGLRQVLVSAYKKSDTAQEAQQRLDEAKAEAEEVYSAFHDLGGDRVLVCLGSVKSNVVIERVIAEAFGLPHYVSQDQVAKVRDRGCPFYLCLRPKDPQPPSCHAGTSLTAAKRRAKAKSPTPGIYYETESGKWECCPCKDNKEDAALVFYIHKRPQGLVEMVMGGFSSQATFALATTLGGITSKLWPPTLQTERLEVAAFVVRFEFDGFGEQFSAELDPLYIPKPSKTTVIPIAESVLRSRLG